METIEINGELLLPPVLSSTSTLTSWNVATTNIAMLLVFLYTEEDQGDSEGNDQWSSSHHIVISEYFIPGIKYEFISKQ